MALSRREIKCGVPVNICEIERSHIWITDENLKFHIREDRLNEIVARVGQRKVYLISIAGPGRGKSTLFSLFVKFLKQKIYGVEAAREERFPIAEGNTTQTPGLWMWSEPFVLPNSPLAILLMDSTGFSTEQSAQFECLFNARVSLLISSCFIFNTTEHLDEHSIQSLQELLEYRIKIMKKTNDHSKISKIQFLVRDWEESPAKFSYGAEGGSGFLQLKLALKPFHVEEEKRIRAVLDICAQANNIGCFLLPSPQVRSFEEHFNSFVQQILNNAQVGMDFQTHTQDFPRLLKMYVKIVEENPRLTSSVIFSATSHASFEESYDASQNLPGDDGSDEELFRFLESYEIEMHKVLKKTADEGLKIEEFHLIHAALSSSIQRLFLQNKTDPRSLKLYTSLGKKFENLRVQNEVIIKKRLEDQRKANVEARNAKESMSRTYSSRMMHNLKDINFKVDEKLFGILHNGCLANCKLEFDEELPDVLPLQQRTELKRQLLAIIEQDFQEIKQHYENHFQSVKSRAQKIVAKAMEDYKAEMRGECENMNKTSEVLEIHNLGYWKYLWSLKNQLSGIQVNSEFNTMSIVDEQLNEFRAYTTQNFLDQILDAEHFNIKQLALGRFAECRGRIDNQPYEHNLHLQLDNHVLKSESLLPKPTDKIHKRGQINNATRLVPRNELDAGIPVGIFLGRYNISSSTWKDGAFERIVERAEDAQYIGGSDFFLRGLDSLNIQDLISDHLLQNSTQNLHLGLSIVELIGVVFWKIRGNIETKCMQRIHPCVITIPLRAQPQRHLVMDGARLAGIEPVIITKTDAIAIQFASNSRSRRLPDCPKRFLVVTFIEGQYSSVGAYIMDNGVLEVRSDTADQICIRENTLCELITAVAKVFPKYARFDIVMASKKIFKNIKAMKDKIKAQNNAVQNIHLRIGQEWAEKGAAFYAATLDGTNNQSLTIWRKTHPTFPMSSFQILKSRYPDNLNALSCETTRDNFENLKSKFNTFLSRSTDDLNAEKQSFAHFLRGQSSRIYNNPSMSAFNKRLIQELILGLRELSDSIMVGRSFFRDVKDDLIRTIEQLEAPSVHNGAGAASVSSIVPIANFNYC